MDKKVYDKKKIYIGYIIIRESKGSCFVIQRSAIASYEEDGLFEVVGTNSRLRKFMPNYAQKDYEFPQIYFEYPKPCFEEDGEVSSEELLGKEDYFNAEANRIIANNRGQEIRNGRQRGRVK